MSKERELQRIVTDILNLAPKSIEDQQEFKAAERFLTKCEQSMKTVDNAYSAELTEARRKRAAAEAEEKSAVSRIKVFSDPLNKAKDDAVRAMHDYRTAVEEERFVEMKAGIFTASLDQAKTDVERAMNDYQVAKAEST